MTDTPLGHLRVIDCGIVQAGPLITRYLGDWGAQVIRIESRNRPDAARTSHYPENKPGKEYWNQGAVFHEQMRNKLSICLELDDPEGVEILKKLMAVSDVFEESFPQRVMRKFGLDYESIKHINPGLIYISTVGYGHGGPYGDYRNYGMVSEAMSGISYLNGYEKDEPMRTSVPYTDHPSTYMGFLAVMSALEHRYQTGEGQWIDFSQYEAGIHMIGDAYVEYSLTGEMPTQNGNQHDEMAPHGVYPCTGEPGWIAIAIRNDTEWEMLKQLMGAPDWSTNPLLDSVTGRISSNDELDNHISKWTEYQKAYELQELLQNHGIASGVVLDHSTLQLDPNMKDRKFYKMVQHHENQERVGKRPFPGPSAKMTETPGDIFRHAPMLGQHNNEVLGDILGYSPEEIERLVEKGVTGTLPIFHDAPAPKPLAPEQRINMVGQGAISSYNPNYRKQLGLDD